MKKTVFRLMALLVCVTMVFTLLIGCGAKKEESTEKTTATVESTSAQQESTSDNNAPKLSATLKVFLAGEMPKGQEIVNNAISEKLVKDGFDFKFEYTVAPFDQFFNKQALMVAGGEESDLTWTHFSVYPGQVAKGLFAPLDDALKAYGQELLKSTPDYVWKQATINGKIYDIPRVAPVASPEECITIREDLRKKYNVPEIKTLDDLEKYFEALKVNEPTMYQMATKILTTVRAYGNYFFPVHDRWSAPFFVDPADPELKVKFFYETEEWNNMAARLRSWYVKGYTPNDYTNKNKTEDNDFTAGKVSAMYGVPLLPTERIDGLRKNVPTAEMREIVLNPEKPKYIFSSVDNGFAVFSTSKHVNEAVAFINWVKSSQENYDLMTYGVKDITYKLVDDKVSYDGVTEDKAYVPNMWMWTDLRYHRFSVNVSAETIDIVKNWDKGAVQSPLLGFTLNTEPIKAEMAKIAALDAQYIQASCFGVSEWSKVKDEALAKYKAAGVDKVIAEIQKQVDAYKTK